MKKIDVFAGIMCLGVLPILTGSENMFWIMTALFLAGVTAVVMIADFIREEANIRGWTLNKFAPLRRLRREKIAKNPHMQR